MNKSQLQRSLELWRRREKYRQKKLGVKKARRDTAGTVKWDRLHDESVRMIHRRQGQLQAAKPLRLKAHEFAVTMIGVMEVGGNNVGPMVGKIIRENGGIPGEAWCGDFMAFVYRHVGSKAVTRWWASVSALGFITGVRHTTNPQTGDLVRFTFDHVGMFEAWVNADDKIVSHSLATHIRTVEGNTGRVGAVSDSKTGGDGVYRKVRARGLVRDYLHVTK